MNGGSVVTTVERRDLLAARRERRRATEDAYVAPTSARVVVHASRARGVLLGMLAAVALWSGPIVEEKVWPTLQQAVVPGR